jgi:hypothetical protein
MAALQNHGEEVVRVFDRKLGALLSVRSDGIILSRTPFSRGWRFHGKLRKDIPSVQEFVKQHPERYCPMRSVPQYETLMRWESEGLAEALDGCEVEPDGVCPHGEPSWLRALHLI